MSDVTAIFLCGGLGSRLRPVVPDVPKILAPVQGRPMLAWQLERMLRAGIQDVVICQAIWWEQVWDVFGDQYHDLRLRYTEEPEPLGTGGALRLAVPMIETETALILNGDTWSAVNLVEFIRFHWQMNCDATSMFRTDGGESDCIATGVYAVERNVLLGLPATTPLSWERYLEDYPRDKKIGITDDLPFYDMGTPEGYELIQGVNLDQ